MRTIPQILSKSGYEDDQLEFFLARCAVDFSYFAEQVLGFDVADYHIEWLDLMEKYPRLCLIAFRGSGKTNWVGGYFIWKSMFSENKNFLILSNTFDQSKIVLRIIRRMITDNDMLRDFVPVNKELAWKATELQLKTGATLYCKTYGENVKGLRIDYLLCDEAGQYPDKSIFWTAVSPVVQLNRGKIIVIGTRESMTDLLGELKDNAEYFVKEYPSEIDGEALWPQRYTMKPEDTETQRSLIKVRKEIGELSYQQEYLLKPISDANSLFPPELTLKAISANEKFLPFGKVDEKYYMGYDIAISPKGDYTVMTILKVNADKVQIVKAKRFRADFQEQKRIFTQLFSDFRPLRTVIDGTAVGEQQAREIEREFSNVLVIKFTYDEKMKMLLDLRQQFEKFNIIIPNSKDDMEAYTYAQQLLEELHNFQLRMDLRPGQTTRPKFHSGKYDDCVISLALANKAAENLSGQVSISTIGWEDAESVGEIGSR